ncbi:MAG: hypothetical protein ABI171_21440 [Collimonas sp.]|uniref:hypothetical protein n=1 Tax=Collimonas sp. TaxID=1963772 RepID=UPI0032631B3F
MKQTSESGLDRAMTDVTYREQGITSLQRDFLSQIAVMLGISPKDCATLVAPATFTGRAGLICRFQLLDNECAVCPEVLLPLSAGELMGTEVVLLLDMQRALLTEFGWYLGTSAEGILQISPTTWIDDAHAAVLALDLINGAGVEALQQLLRSSASLH